MKNFIKIFFLIWGIYIPAYLSGQSFGKTVVFSDSLDPYYPLALEITAEENIVLVNNIVGIADYKPNFVLWVISPEKLIEEKLVEYSLNQKMNGHYFFTGIISGKNINDARKLWENRDYKPDKEYVFVKGTNEQNRISPKIIKTNENSLDTLALDKENLIKVLATSSYVELSLHGAARSWFDEANDLNFLYNELPKLPNSIIESRACENFRPWIENSIALECIEKGAIAFSGFVYSPISGTQIGVNNGLNFRYTWDEFPIGAVVQIQNRVTERSYALFPNYYLLGDPRLSLNTTPSYNVVADSTTEERRIIKLDNAQKGFLPVKITGGEIYEYISISNGIKFSVKDRYINKYIESIDLYGDKYLLFENRSDSVTIVLQKSTPRIWKSIDTFKDTIDSIIVSNQYSGNEIIGAIFIIILAIVLYKNKISKESVIKYLALSIIGVILLGALYILRWNSIDITGKMIGFNLSTFIFDGILLLSGIVFYFRAKTNFKRIFASAIPFIPNFLFILFYLIVFLITSFLSPNKVEVTRLGYLISLSLIEACVGTIFLYLSLRFIKAKT